MRYIRLKHNVFTYTMQAVLFPEILIDTLRFILLRLDGHPMKKEVDAHEYFPLSFNRYGVPHNMVMGGPKDQTIGSFRKK